MDKRYSRQVSFEEIGKKGQEKISESTITIVGVGALGSVSAELLARAGVKKLILIDSDNVELSNLQRQALYTESDVGQKKVISLKKHLQKINSSVEVEAVDMRIGKNNASIIHADMIIDGTDNMETRFLLNKYSKGIGIPYIYGAAAGSIGIVFAVTKESPCLNCVFKHAKNFLTCNNIGIINPITYSVASIQVAEALKIIVEKSPSHELIRFDLWKNTFDFIKVKKDNDCDVCFPKEAEKESPFVIQECRTKSSFIAKPKGKVKLDLYKLSENFETIENAGIICVLKIDGEEVIVHDYGELVFKTLKDTEKMREIAKKVYSFRKR